MISTEKLMKFCGRFISWILIALFIVNYYFAFDFPSEYYVWEDVLWEAVWHLIVLNLFIPLFAAVASFEEQTKQLYYSFNVHTWKEAVICTLIALNTSFVVICAYQYFFGDLSDIKDFLRAGDVWVLLFFTALGAVGVHSIRDDIKEKRLNKAANSGEVDHLTVRIGDSVYAMSYDCPEVQGVVIGSIKNTNKIVVLVTIYGVIKVKTIFSDNFLALDKYSRRGDTPLRGYSYGYIYERR